jgi:hypothetical protein
MNHLFTALLPWFLGLALTGSTPQGPAGNGVGCCPGCPPECCVVCPDCCGPDCCTPDCCEAPKACCDEKKACCDEKPAAPAAPASSCGSGCGG